MCFRRNWQIPTRLGLTKTQWFGEQAEYIEHMVSVMTDAFVDEQAMAFLGPFTVIADSTLC